MDRMDTIHTTDMRGMQDKLDAVRQRADAFEKAYDRKGVTRWLRTEGRREMEKVLAQADRLMEQTFVFQDPWDMEPCSIPYQLRPMDWGASPNGDPEWTYMLNRHSYLKKLMLAGWYTKDRRYLDKLKELLFHWILHVPIKAGSSAARTIDTGIRCMNWAPLLAHLSAMDLLSGEEMLTILRSLSEQLAYLKDSYAEKYRLSNWGVLQTTSILTNGLWYGEFLDPELVQWASQELEKELELQIYEDGSHWEQSILYHIEVLNACSTLLATAQMLRGTQLSAAQMPEKGPGHRSLKKLYRMYGYVQMAAGPDHMQQAQGDSDVTDVRDVLTTGALLFWDPALKSGGYPKLDLENVWLFGMQGILAYDRLGTRSPDRLEGIFPESGNLYFRTSWREDAHFTYLKNGPLGSSHGHADLTHISIYYQGVQFLTDLGRYSYQEHEPLRTQLKNPPAHNICQVEDAGAGLADGSWSYAFYGDCLKNYTMTLEQIHYVEMPFLSRRPGGQMAFQSRRVLIFPEGIWLIADEIRMDGVHKSQTIFHFAPEVKKCPFRPEGAEALASPPEQEVLLERDGIRLKLGNETGWAGKKERLSRRYNETEEHLVFTSRDEWKDEGWIMSWLTPEDVALIDTPVFQAEKDSRCGPELVTAKEILIAGQPRYIAILFRHEVCRGRKVFSCQGTSFYGKAVVLKKEGSHFRPVRFRA